MDVNTWDVILLIISGVLFLVGAGIAFTRPVLVHVAVALISGGLLFWLLVPLIDHINAI